MPVEINHWLYLIPLYFSVCVFHLCPVDGGWTAWGQWSSCDVTCGDGDVSRHRTCTSPAPQHGGLDCPGSDTVRMRCNLTQTVTPCKGIYVRSLTFKSFMFVCHRYYIAVMFDLYLLSNWSTLRFLKKIDLDFAVDGSWGDWSAWGSCDVTCGNGDVTRRRSCDNPPPAYGGNNCTDNGVQTQPCALMDCPSRWTLCWILGNVSWLINGPDNETVEILPNGALHHLPKTSHRFEKCELFYSLLSTRKNNNTGPLSKPRQRLQVQNRNWFCLNYAEVFSSIFISISRIFYLLT